MNGNNDSFWNQQNKIRQEILDKNKIEEQGKKSELDRWKQDVIASKVAEVEEWNRTHGNSGNFFTDFKYGFGKAYRDLGKPFLKYGSKALSYVPDPRAQSLSKAMDGGSQVLDKLM